MQRKIIGAVLLAATVLVLSGCGSKPAGVDGNLVDDWPLPPEPKIPVPTAPACYNVQTEDPTDVAKWPPPVDCATSHTVESLHVGQFEGADASRASVPPSGSAERRKAFEQCSKLSTDYLGGDWRAGKLELYLVLPSDLHWEAGARWFRCDLVQNTDIEDYTVVTRTGSLKGGLGGELRLGCATISASGDDVDGLKGAACSSPHNGEFVGIFDLPDGAYPTDDSARSKANLDGCRGLVASYTGIPNDGNFQYRTGQVASPFSKADWELGNRGVRCYVWSPKNVTNSLKGVGTNGLPINYA